MKRIVPAAIVSLLVAACAAPGPGPAPAPKAVGAKAADPLNPNVTVVDGKTLAVDPDPLVFGKSVKNVVITWRLARGGAYTFPKDGITIQDGAAEFVNCHPETNGFAFACVNVHSKPGNYKYTIKVEGSPAIPPFDPTIVNY